MEKMWSSEETQERVKTLPGQMEGAPTTTGTDLQQDGQQERGTRVPLNEGEGTMLLNHRGKLHTIATQPRSSHKKKKGELKKEGATRGKGDIQKEIAMWSPASEAAVTNYTPTPLSLSLPLLLAEINNHPFSGHPQAPPPPSLHGANSSAPQPTPSTAGLLSSHLRCTQHLLWRASQAIF